MGNLDIYNRVREVPKEAQKSIVDGRLKGMTDINPMWRIKKLTEEFGPVGFGWYTSDVIEDVIPGNDGEMIAKVTLNLHVKQGGEWSQPIFGTGGAMLVAKEKNGLYTDDEAFKKAYTDALSVACKALGIGADIYFAKDSTKYTSAAEPVKYEPKNTERKLDSLYKCECCGAEIKDSIRADGSIRYAEDSVKYSQEHYKQTLCNECIKRRLNGNQG